MIRKFFKKISGLDPLARDDGANAAAPSGAAAAGAVQAPSAAESTLARVAHQDSEIAVVSLTALSNRRPLESHTPLDLHMASCTAEIAEVALLIEREYPGVVA